MSDQRLTDEQVANITRRRFTNDPIGNCGVTPCPTVRLITEATQ